MAVLDKLSLRYVALDINCPYERSFGDELPLKMAIEYHKIIFPTATDTPVMHMAGESFLMGNIGVLAWGKFS